MRALGGGPPRPSFVVEYALPDGGPASLEVYDDRGRRAGVVAADRFRCGIHAAEWRPDRAAPGTYWWRLRAPGGVDLLQPFERRA